MAKIKGEKKTRRRPTRRLHPPSHPKTRLEPAWNVASQANEMRHGRNWRQTNRLATLAYAVCSLERTWPCTRAQQGRGIRRVGVLLRPRPPTRYPEPCVALCASFELSNIQVRTGKYIYLPRVRAQRWWMTWPVELWWPGDRAPLINRLQGLTPLCVINKRCSSLLFPCHR